MDTIYRAAFIAESFYRGTFITFRFTILGYEQIFSFTDGCCCREHSDFTYHLFAMQTYCKAKEPKHRPTDTRAGKPEKETGTYLLRERGFREMPQYAEEKRK